MGIILEQRDDSDLVRLDGAVDIASAAELKSALLQALKSGRAVRVAVEQATDLDVTAVQLLWAPEREARASGVVFAVEGQVPAAVSGALCELGFASFPVPVCTE